MLTNIDIFQDVIEKPLTSAIEEQFNEFDYVTDHVSLLSELLQTVGKKGGKSKILYTSNARIWGVKLKNL